MIGFRIADALGAGYSSKEIIDHLVANPLGAHGIDMRTLDAQASTPTTPTP